MNNKVKTIENKVRHILNKNGLPKPEFIKIFYYAPEKNKEVDFDGTEFELDIDGVYNVYIHQELTQMPPKSFFIDMQRLDTKWFKKYGEHIWLS